MRLGWGRLAAAVKFLSLYFLMYYNNLRAHFKIVREGVWGIESEKVKYFLLKGLLLVIVHTINNPVDHNNVYSNGEENYKIHLNQ